MHRSKASNAAYADSVPSKYNGFEWNNVSYDRTEIFPTFQHIKDHFTYPLEKAASLIEICTTALKRSVPTIDAIDVRKMRIWKTGAAENLGFANGRIVRYEYSSQSKDLGDLI